MRINGASWVPIVLGLVGGCASGGPATGGSAGAGYDACEMTPQGDCPVGCEKDAVVEICQPLPPPPPLAELDAGVDVEPEPDAKPDARPDAKPDRKPPVCDGGACPPEEPAPPPDAGPPPVEEPPTVEEPPAPGPIIIGAG